MVYAVQTGRPVARSRAFSQPWIPNSPPEAPTRTRFFTTKGAMGVASPCEASAILVAREDAGREAPDRMQAGRVRGGDLGQRAVACRGVVAGGHGPLTGPLRRGGRDAAGAHGAQRRDEDDNDATVRHTSSSLHPPALV